MARDDIPGTADDALVDAARSGDAEAFAELWRRHAPAGSVAARQFAHIADAEDLLAEAYARILSAVRRGGGPRGAFRPYLYRTIRNLALDWRRPPTVPLDDADEAHLTAPSPELAAAERAIGVRAFRSLPERWQTVLWYFDIEGMEPAEVAPLLGVSPNAASALVLRAREGLKKAWLQAHVNEGAVPEGCRWTTTRMGDYSRGGLPRRHRARFDEHLDSCERCTSLVGELEDAGGRLAVLLLPLLVGTSAAAVALAGRSGHPDGAEATSPGAAGLSSATAARAATPQPRWLVMAGAGVAGVAVAVAGVALAASLSAAPAAPSGGPEPAPSTLADDPRDPSPTEEPETAAVEPAPEPEAPAPPRPQPPPAPPPVEPPPPPTPPAAPSSPVVDFDPASGRIAASGAGDVPGATIELWGTTTSITTGVTSPETLLASTIVAPDGTWTTPQAGGITPINVTVAVRQVRDGVTSASVELISDAVFNVETASTTAAVTGSTATWELLGWAGAEWELREAGSTTVVASGVFAADGTAVATVSLPSVPAGTVLAFDYGYVEGGAIVASAPGLTATAV